MEVFIKKVIASLWPGILLGVVQGALLAALMGSTTWAVLGGHEIAAKKIATLVLVNGIVLQLITPLLQFSSAYRGFIQGLASAKQLLDMIGAECMATTIEHRPNNSNSEFRISNMSVDIEGRKILPIEQLDIPAKQLVVLKGPSGSGKTTLAKCLAGLNEYEGLVHSSCMSKYIFFMTQDVHVFDVDIDENITLGLPIVSEKLYKALQRSCSALEF